MMLWVFLVAVGFANPVLLSEGRGRAVAPGAERPALVVRFQMTFAMTDGDTPTTAEAPAGIELVLAPTVDGCFEIRSALAIHPGASIADLALQTGLFQQSIGSTLCEDPAEWTGLQDIDPSVRDTLQMLRELLHPSLFPHLPEDRLRVGRMWRVSTVIEEPGQILQREAHWAVVGRKRQDHHITFRQRGANQDDAAVTYTEDLHGGLIWPSSAAYPTRAELTLTARAERTDEDAPLRFTTEASLLLLPRP
ncbi:MAG: hypothetical protein ACON5B_01105 [Myxococcota bacterium]